LVVFLTSILGGVLAGIGLVLLTFDLTKLKSML
jgi:hypothetical protein